jgi:DNA-binding response OmpR family regulator
VLENTVVELEKVNNTKDHFFSILAHDLKDPVAALTDISDFMKSNFFRMDRKDVQQYLDTIHQSSDAVHNLLINLLNWSRTQSKKIACTPVPINLQELIYNNILLLRPQFDSKHIDLQLDIHPHHSIFADHNMADTVVRNLLSNSIKFTEYNGVVRITSGTKEGYTTLSIQDNGIGMSDEQLQHLFCIDKMFTTNGTAGEKGTGLGLIITKEFIQVNNGYIEVTSEPGKGTTFEITLPHATNEIKTTMPEERLDLDFWEVYPVDKLLKLKGKKILIVDDNSALRDYLKLILSNTFEIVEAENGQDALLLAQEIKPDLIISDLMMPVMNGLQFCKEIKAVSTTPLIILTSQWVDNIQFSGYEAGADAYLTKPVKKELLLQIILNLIRNQEQLYPETATLNKPDEDFLHTMALLIEENITASDLDAKWICKEMNISRTVLYAKMKTLTGQTVHEFIKTIKLQKSLSLLLEGRLSISQIASEVGFNSHSYFDKCFIKQYGVGPKEYIAAKKIRGYQ